MSVKETGYIPTGEKLEKTNSNEREKTSFLAKMISIYFFFTPLDFLQIIPNVSVSRFLIFLPVISCGLYISKAKLKVDKFFVLLIAYLMVITLSMTYSVHLESTLERTITIALNTLAILLLSMFEHSKYELYSMQKAVMLSGWLTAVLMIVYANTSLMKGRLTIIVGGDHQDPNELCGFLIYTIIYYLREFLVNKRKMCIVYIGFFVVLIFLTGSRSGLIAVFGATLCYLALWIKNTTEKKKAIIIFLLLLVVIGVFILILFEFLPETIKSRISLDFTLKDRGADRFDIWRRALYCLKASCIQDIFFGHGSGTIRYFLCGKVAHNVWLESLIEIGVVGTVSLALLYSLYFIRAIKMKQHVVTGCFFGYLILTLSLSLYSYKPIWNILFIIIMLNNADESSDEEQSKVYTRKKFEK